MSIIEALEEKYLSRKEYKRGYTDWNPDFKFELEEAVCLVGREIVELLNDDLLPNPPKNVRGAVVGLVSINDEVELIIRWENSMDQFVKTEFCADYELVPKPLK